MQNKARLELADYEATADTCASSLGVLVNGFVVSDFLNQKIKHWQMQLDRHRLKMSKVAESLLAYTEQYLEYDPFLVPPDPSNPWISDDTTFWELEASKEPGQQRVKRWGFGMDEALKDPVGREQFLKFLESEFSSENLRFWLAVEDLKKRPIREVPARVQEIWQEFLAPGAPSAINLDSKSYDKTTQNVKDPGRYTFEDAQEHIYKLMKSDSYPRFIRSSAYQELLQAKKKLENTLDRRTSFEKFTRNVHRKHLPMCDDSYATPLKTGLLDAGEIAHIKEVNQSSAVLLKGSPCSMEADSDHYTYFVAH
ncbi:regulator of G-protein signaling 7 isoform X1 [Pitangus sulphuratus]|nr:regulator of G-protein signaling 7 isoform X1 [Pitangus sulphuratus]